MQDQELNEFVSLLKEALNAPGSQVLKADTNFMEVEGVSSMQMMILINAVDRKYNVVIDVIDVFESKTARQLYSTIQSKTKSG